MNYTLIDLSGVLVATAACGLVLVLPAIALGHLTNFLSFRSRPDGEAYGIALIAGYALLPVLDSLLCRQLGLGAALLANLAFAVFAIRVVWQRGWPRLSPHFGFASCIWLCVILMAWVDFDWQGRLYPSLLMIDTVKHAATVRALVDAGAAPPIDPFFLRADPAGYYYFFYIASALAERLGGGLFDSRAAVAGQIFWTGLALVSLLRLLLEKAGIARHVGPRLRAALLFALMTIGGLQLIPVLLIGLGSGLWLGQVNWWNDQVTSLLLSLLWVPHHVAALVACWAGLLLLAASVEHECIVPRKFLSTLVLAGVAFASAAGLSVWVTGAAGLAVALWACVLSWERRWAALAAIATAGAIGLVLALPYLVDLLSHRAQGNAPIALTLRPFPFTDAFLATGPTAMLARLVSLPLNYILEFGLLAVGSYLYWRHAASRTAQDAGAETRRLLAVTALAGLLIASFLKSTIINNDLAWRAVLFAQIAAIVWSTAAFAPLLERAERGPFLRHAPATFVIAAILGYGAVAYDLVGLRAYHGLGLGGEAGMRRDPVLDRELRGAYTWLARHPDPALVVQHNPDAERAFAYGLYGRSRVAIADRHNARIFGAAPGAVAERLNQLTPVYSGLLAGLEARARLATGHVGAIVVTSADPIWHDAGAWIWSAPTLFRSAHVRVIPIAGAMP